MPITEIKKHYSLLQYLSLVRTLCVIKRNMYSIIMLGIGFFTLNKNNKKSIFLFMLNF